LTQSNNVRPRGIKLRIKAVQRIRFFSSLGNSATTTADKAGRKRISVSKLLAIKSIIRSSS